MATIMKPVHWLRAGDLVDLQGDKYADPTGENPALACEYQRVDHIKDERDKADCIAVGFEGFDVVGFPSNHLVAVEKCPTVTISSPREFNDTEKDLAASLACYCSDEDWGESREHFLHMVRDRIDMDLRGKTT